MCRIIYRDHSLGSSQHPLAAPLATALQQENEWGDERGGRVKIPDQIGCFWLSADMIATRNGGLLLAQHEWIDQAWDEQLMPAVASLCCGAAPSRQQKMLAASRWGLGSPEKPR